MEWNVMNYNIAPERIWAHRYPNGIVGARACGHEPTTVRYHEYVRADVHRELQARAEAAEADAKKWEDACHNSQQAYFSEVEARKAAEAERDRLREVLGWYGEQARLARLTRREGDEGRHALAADGGKKARAALQGESTNHD
jgi:hypothetical protein